MTKLLRKWWILVLYYKIEESQVMSSIQNQGMVNPQAKDLLGCVWTPDPPISEVKEP